MMASCIQMINCFVVLVSHQFFSLSMLCISMEVRFGTW